MTEDKMIEILAKAAAAGIWDIDEAIEFIRPMPKYFYWLSYLKAEKRSREIFDNQLETFSSLMGSPAYSGLLVLKKKDRQFIKFFKRLYENSYIEIDGKEKKLVLCDELLSLRRLITYIKLIPGQPKGRRKNFWITFDKIFGYPPGRFSQNTTGTDNPPQKTKEEFKKLFY